MAISDYHISIIIIIIIVIIIIIIIIIIMLITYLKRMYMCVST